MMQEPGAASKQRSGVAPAVCHFESIFQDACSMRASPAGMQKAGRDRPALKCGATQRSQAARAIGADT